MPKDVTRLDRSWQEITSDAVKENNPERLLELSKELDRALDVRKNHLPPIRDKKLTQERTA